MKHDFEEQRCATEEVLADLASKIQLPERANLDLQFVPVAGADGDGLAEALAAAGYAGELIVDEDDEWFEVTVADVPVTLDGIWQHERATTEVALSFGFRPDGWGFSVD